MFSRLKAATSDLRNSIQEFVSPSAALKSQIIPSKLSAEECVPESLPRSSAPSALELFQQKFDERASAAAEASSKMRGGISKAKGEDDAGSGSKAKDRVLGVANAIAGGASTAYYTSANKLMNSMHENGRNRDMKRFFEEFGFLVKQMNCSFIGAHDGFVLHDDEPHAIILNVTTTHLCISGKAVTALIPLEDILSVRPAISLEQRDTITPYFALLPAAVVLPTAILVYTKNMECFKFFKFTFPARQLATNYKLPPGMTATVSAFVDIENAWWSAREATSRE